MPKVNANEHKKMHNHKDKYLEIFSRTFRDQFGNNLKRIILFGSRARGDYNEESDYDFILIFDKVSKELKEDVTHLVVDLMIEHGIVITNFIFTEEELKKRRFAPFIMNAQREGIVL